MYCFIPSTQWEIPASIQYHLISVESCCCLLLIEYGSKIAHRHISLYLKSAQGLETILISRILWKSNDQLDLSKQICIFAWRSFSILPTGAPAQISLWVRPLDTGCCEHMRLVLSQYCWIFHTITLADSLIFIWLPRRAPCNIHFSDKPASLSHAAQNPHAPVAHSSIDSYWIHVINKSTEEIHQPSAMCGRAKSGICIIDELRRKHTNCHLFDLSALSLTLCRSHYPHSTSTTPSPPGNQRTIARYHSIRNWSRKIAKIEGDNVFSQFRSVFLRRFVPVRAVKWSLLNVTRSCSLFSSST